MARRQDFDKPYPAATRLESSAYHYTMKNREPPLSVHKAGELFNLFVNGRSCKEIAEANPGVSLGQVVRARAENRWDERRLEANERIHDSYVDRVTQVNLEAVMFSADLLAAIHKLHGEKLRKYLQTGDESHLAGMGLGSIKSYKEAVDLVIKLNELQKKNLVSSEKIKEGGPENEGDSENEGAAESGVDTSDKSAMLKLLSSD